MSNQVEFVLRLKDMMSGALNAVGSTATSVFKRVSNAVDATKSKTDALPQSIQQIRQQLDTLRTTREISISKRQIREADRDIDALERKLRKMERPSASGGGGIGSWLKQGLAVAGIGGALAMGGGVVNAGINAEQQQMSFEVMLGNAAKAKQFITDIRTMGAATPFTSNDLAKGAELMMGFGIANERVIPIMRTIGDVSRGNVERFNSLTLAFSQATAAGRLQGQDLLQMINGGFNPLQQMIKDKVFPSMSAAKDAMEKGQISARMLEMAFQSASGKGGMFFNMMEKQSQTAGGRFSTLMDNIQMIGITLGTALIPAINMFIDFTNWILENKEVIIALGAAVGTYIVVMNAATWATKAWSIAQTVLNVIMNLNPIVLIISLIIGLIGWIISLCNKYDNWGKSIKAIWEIIKTFVKLTVLAWKDFFLTSWYWIQLLWFKIQHFVEWIGGAFANVGRSIKLAFQGKFSEAKAALTAEIKTTAQAKIEALEKSETARRAEVASEYAKGFKNIAENVAKVDFSVKKQTEVAKKTADATGATAKDWSAAKADGKANGKGGKSGLDGEINGVAGGGGKNVTIQLGKFFDNINLHTTNLKEGTTDIERVVMECMRRILNSANV